MPLKKVSVKTPAAKTDTTPYKGHFGLYVTGFAVATLVFCTTAWFAHEGVPTWEHGLAHAVNVWPNKLNSTMLVIGFFGSQWAAAIAVIGVFVARYYRLALRMAISILVAVAASFGTKHLVSRERPSILFHDIHARVSTNGCGFPSSHAVIVTVIFLSLLPYLHTRWRWIVPVAIAGVAVAEIYAGISLPLDMLGGVALGTMVVALLRVLPQSLRVFLRID